MYITSTYLYIYMYVRDECKPTCTRVSKVWGVLKNGFELQKMILFNFPSIYIWPIIFHCYIHCKCMFYHELGQFSRQQTSSIFIALTVMKGTSSSLTTSKHNWWNVFDNSHTESKQVHFKFSILACKCSVCLLGNATFGA